MKILFYMFFFPISVFAQLGGIDAFVFANIEVSPRIEAMGGNLIACYDSDASLAHTTPSLLNKDMNNQLTFSFTDYFSDINLLGVSYAKNLLDIGVFLVGVKSIHYGIFDLNDEVGNTQGIFSANDQVITFGVGKRLTDRFSLGVNLNLLNSNYESYSSFALATNVSFSYILSKHNFSSTLIIKNLGRQLKGYTDAQEDLPFEVQIGLSKTLAHLPFRYHLSYTNLNQFDIKSPYQLTSQTNVQTGELEIKEEFIAKTFLRHIIIGGELNPFKKNFFIRGGFNFQRRFDMSISTSPAMVGFSWGVGFNIYRLRFDYSRSLYHLSGVPNNFSIGTNIDNFGI